MKRNIFVCELALAFSFLRPATTAAQAPTIPANNASSVASTMLRVLAAHGPQWATGTVADWTARGVITYFTVAGPGPTFDVSLVRKGPSQVQRIVTQSGLSVRIGSDGNRVWDSLNGWFVGKAQGQSLDFIESQTVRSVQTLLNYQSVGLMLRNAGQIGKTQLIESEDVSGRKTTFFIDPDTFTISKLEFVQGQTKDAFGNSVSITETYVFSDNRLVQGLLTPFKTERYVNGIKSEEIRLSSIAYNTSVKDDAFRP